MVNAIQDAGAPLLDGRESVGELVAMLGQSSLRVRRAAAGELAERAPAETVPGLLAALGDDENATARNAAGDVLLRYGHRVVSALTRALDGDGHRDRTIQLLGLLGELPCREVVEAVIRLAAHADASVAAAAIGSLGQLKDPAAVPILMSVLDSKERWQTFHAIDALGEIGHAAAVNLLVPLASDPYFRKAVLRALGRIGDESAVRPLVQGLIHKDRPDRTALASLNDMVDRTLQGGGREALLARIRDELKNLAGVGLTTGLVALSRTAETEVRIHSLRALGWLEGVEVIRPLVEGLAEPTLAEAAGRALLTLGAAHAEAILAAAEDVVLPPGGLRWVIEAVGHVATPRVDAFLIEGLRHEEEEIRHSAAACLARHPCVRHLEALVEALGDPSPAVADEAVHALLSLAATSEASRDEVAGRVDGLTASSSPEIRRAGLRVVGKLQMEGVREILDLALRDPVAAVRREATALLGDDPDPERLWRLTGALADEDARVREEAVIAVGRLHDERARGVLLASLHDRSIWVRCRAASALADHPAVEVQAALEQAARVEVLPVRVSAVEALGRLADGAEGTLKLLVGDSEPEVRRATLRALASRGADGSLPVLAAALEDPVWVVRCAAAEALGACGLAGGFGPLSHALDREVDAVVRSSLLTALFHVDAESALPFLVAALAEKDVAETAAELLVAGHRVFADELRAEWAVGVDPATREGLALVLQEIGRRESTRSADGSRGAPG